MRRRQINSLIAAVLLAWTLWPVACVALSMMVAHFAGATLDESDVHPCVIGGVDYGATLNTLFVLGWLGLITLPTGGIALLLQAIVATVEWRVSLRRRKRAMA